MNDLVSIITPVYNSEKFVAETIQSVQKQIYSNWELIIIDDGSSDLTTQIVEKYSQTDPRIILHKNMVNIGTGATRQKGLDMATGKFIAFLDGDDLWHKLKLNKQIQFMKTHQLPFTFCFYEWIDENSQPLNKYISCPNPLKLKQLKYCNHIGNLTGIYDVDFFGKINISSLRKRQDWIMWLDILKKTKVAYPVPEYLAYYRKSNQSLSANKWRLIKYNYQVFTDYWHYAKITAAFHLMIFLFHQLVLKRKYIKTNVQTA
jgi:glycosyltransferase involved in cell wall biosynthesis